MPNTTVGANAQGFSEAQHPYTAALSVKAGIELESKIRDMRRIAEITAHYAHEVVDWPSNLITDEPGSARQLGHVLFLLDTVENMAKDLVEIYYAAHEEARVGKEARS